ncbi:glycosyltransferase [Patescibacteria group bacterium]
MKQLKVALVHDYLLQNGGAEKTLEAICELYPNAPIYTSGYKEKPFKKSVISKREIIVPKGANFLFNLFPILSKYFTFLRPLIFEDFDLSQFDIVISDSSAYAKGVLTKPNQLHICYIHTPPRFLYKYSVESTKRNAWYYKPVVMYVDHFLRLWDYLAAQRPDYLVANSNEIKKRIKKFYNREATIIYPPVELANKQYSETINEDYFLIAGRLVAYKNFDVVIKAFNELPNLNLYIIGSGNTETELKKLAKQNTKFLGRVTDEDKHKYMNGCLGLINSVKDEDFGIVPIEVLSHGKPVLAHRSAGHLETVIENKTGMYFDDLEVDHLKNKILEFHKKIKANDFNKDFIIQSSQKFSKEEFMEKFKAFVKDKWTAFEVDNKAEIS